MSATWKRRGRAIVALVCLVGAAVAASTVVAQDEAPPAPDTITITVGTPPYPLVLKRDEAVILYADKVTTTNEGQFTEGLVIAQTAYGPVQLTACDNERISCQPLVFKIDGAQQGDSWIMRKYDGR